jgi:PRTRC genetic system protein B
MPTDHSRFAVARPEPLSVSEPGQAILFHRAPGHSRASPSAITYHAIAARNGVPTIQPGRPLSMRDAETLLRTLVGEHEAPMRWMPSDVLAQGDDALVWYVPGTVRPMYFAQGTRTLTREVPWPTLIFKACGTNIALAAVKARGRPTRRTPLYHAPLWNVYRDGRVCLGSVQVSPLSGLDSIAECEAAIFDSRFSHGIHRENLRHLDTPDGADLDIAHLRFWQSLHDAHAGQFPTQHLVPMRLRLGDWIGVGTRGTQ